jgi:MFS transporter, Spinster family, sphingosine-1-phosphate transporter
LHGPLKKSLIGRTLREFATNSVYRNAVFGYTAYTFTLGGFATWCPKYAAAVRGMELSKANYMLGIITVVAGVGGTLAGGTLATRLLLKNGKRGPVWLMVMSSFLATPFAFAAFFSPTVMGFSVCLAIAQFALFMGHSPVNVVIVEAVPFYIRATALALTTFVIHILGDLISPPLVGKIADLKDLETGVLILPAALILCTWFWWLTYRAVSQQATA